MFGVVGKDATWFSYCDKYQALDIFLHGRLLLLKLCSKNTYI